ncbi:MAG: hypothetical protein WBC63_08140 [Candidatus Bipolaricaulia bacterium]
MNRKPLARAKPLRAVSLLLISAAIVILAGTLSAQERGIGAWESYVRSVSSFDHLQALQEYMASITGEGHLPERQVFLANPRGVLQSAGIPVEANEWTVIALDMTRGVDVGAFGFSPSRDVDRPARPQAIGSTGENVVLAVQLAGEADAGLDAVDVFFDLLLGIDDQVVADLSAAVGLLDGKSPGNVDRSDVRFDAWRWLREELRVDIDRLVYRVVAIDYQDADAFTAEHGGDPLYTIDAAAGSPPMGHEVIGFIYEDIGVLLQGVQ